MWCNKPWIRDHIEVIKKTIHGAKSEELANVLARHDSEVELQMAMMAAREFEAGASLEWLSQKYSLPVDEIKRAVHKEEDPTIAKLKERIAELEEIAELAVRIEQLKNKLPPNFKGAVSELEALLDEIYI